MLRNLTRAFFAGLVALSATLAYPAPDPAAERKALAVQVERLAELLRDQFAAYYPDATISKKVKLPGGSDVVLAVFTVEGYGGGNNHTQYLAAFEPGIEAEKPFHFSLIDVIPFGGKGSRAITSLDVQVQKTAQGTGAVISFKVLELADGDAPNFPSRKAVARVQLSGGRLTPLR